MTDSYQTKEGFSFEHHTVKTVAGLNEVKLA